MIAGPTLDALARIQARAQDAMQAYRAGSTPSKADVPIADRAPEYSSDPLSVAAPSGTYFAVRDRTGSQAFTRDGSFTIGGRALLGADGRAILGYPAGSARGGVPAPLELPAADAALGRCGDVRIESDGTLAYTRISIDPRTQERSVERIAAGTIVLAKFPAGTQPIRLDATTVGAPPGIPAHLGTPADGTFAGLATYSRDTGGVDIDASLDRLSEAYLAFSALHAANKARGGVEKTTLDLVK
ncbi:MAG: hypothetical protein NVSMB5_03750 [Candidatus Velthaea sp.]